MRLPKQSSWEWLAIAALLLLGSRRKRKHTGPGKRDVPGTHRIPQYLSLAQLRELATAVGMADPITGAAIAMAESSGNTRAVGDHGDSIGLWQINVPAHKEYSTRKEMLFHAGFNAQAAHAISSGGTNWQPWKAYTSGRYKQYMTP